MSSSMNNPKKLMLSGMLSMLTVMLTPLTVCAGPFDAYLTDGHSCSKTANAALNACTNGLRDDFWINTGKCLNLTDAEVAEECMLEAKQQRMEDLELCGDQYAARNDICDLLGESPYDPQINPADFVDVSTMATMPNPYLPLTPGLTKVFQAGDETITVTVTDQSREILGVTCVVVRDTVEVDGELVEDTDDWLAQDIHGNVWYFGEISRNYEDGELNNLEGSWQAGVDGAKPGILMKAAPQVGDVYRQEFLLGEAEDMGQVISTSETMASVPAADCSGGCVVTRDFLPIEPDASEHKYFAPGIGEILAIDLETGDREELVDIVYP